MEAEESGSSREGELQSLGVSHARRKSEALRKKLEQRKDPTFGGFTLRLQGVAAKSRDPVNSH